MGILVNFFAEAVQKSLKRRLQTRGQSPNCVSGEFFNNYVIRPSAPLARKSCPDRTI